MACLVTLLTLTPGSTWTSSVLASWGRDALVSFPHFFVRVRFPLGLCVR